jgi:hypothetical protein
MAKLELDLLETRMKVSFFLQQKLKLAALLASIMVCILVANLIVRYNLQKIDKTFTSIYKDRLIPSRDLFYASENIHSKVLMMDGYFQNKNEGTEHLKKSIILSNLKLDSILTKYEKTFLVKEEERTLQTLKQKIDQLKACELEILASEDNGFQNGKQLYETKEISLIHETIHHLQQLTNIQARVGDDLFEETQGEILANSSLSTLQIVLVIVIGIIANGLILSSKLVNQKEQKFHLN